MRLDFTSNLIANGSAFILMAMLLACKPKNTGQINKSDRIFYLMVKLTMIQCIIEIGSIYVDGRPGETNMTLNILFNALLYIIIVVLSLLWVIYTDYKFFSSMDRIKRIYPWISIPAALLIIASIINLFIPVFFFVSAANVYSRTKLYIIPLTVNFMYMIYGLVLVKKYRNRLQRYVFYPVMTYSIPILIFSLIQCLHYGLSLTWLGVAIALTTIHMNLQNDTAYVDMLSGLYNRHFFTASLENNICQTRGGKHLAGLMMDLDAFKSINDNFGHVTGDDAIHEAGQILLSIVRKGNGNIYAYRFAGDEFILLCWVNDEEDLKKYVDFLREEERAFNKKGHKKYQLLFSIGYTISKGSEDNPDDFLKRMDEEMYKNKRQRIADGIITDRRGNRK